MTSESGIPHHRLLKELAILSSSLSHVGFYAIERNNFESFFF